MKKVKHSLLIPRRRHRKNGSILTSPLFGPTFYLGEALRNVRNNIPVPRQVRDFLVLVDVHIGDKSLFEIDQETLHNRDLFYCIGEEYLIYCEERQIVLEEIARLFVVV
jgi:hypothetical protein